MARNEQEITLFSIIQNSRMYLFTAHVHVSQCAVKNHYTNFVTLQLTFIYRVDKLEIIYRRLHAQHLNSNERGR